MTIHEFHQKVEEYISRIEELGEPEVYHKFLDEQTNHEHLASIVEQIGELAGCFNTDTGLPSEKHLYNQLRDIAGMIAEWAIRLEIEDE